MVIDNVKVDDKVCEITGEARIILLVNDIVNAQSNSLILIDEPEISLHPSAIYKFKEFL
ncbi:Uncharacterised protein [Streptococcus pneumoniae]|nr:Uncharacterised protein [Streptococcus pneumoniae]